MDTYTYRREYVKCGKPGCKRCPHGPYWYSYQHREGRMKKRYHGKDDPRTRRPEYGEQAAMKADPRDAIFNRRTATPNLARQILGVGDRWTWLECEKRYKTLAMANHPDRGGDVHEMQLIVAAFSFLKAWVSDRM